MRVTILRVFAALALVCFWAGELAAADAKSRLLVVSSYHREYLWSQDTNRGVTAALIEFGYLDDQGQADAFTRDDMVESSRAVARKMWMDTKRKTTKADINAAVGRVLQAAEEFKPDVILLGDDNAANYVGNQFIDTETPVVFWGVNGVPLKYGLLDSLEKPGHNVTGVYQAGYLMEGVQFLKKLLPDVKTMGVLSDDSPTGRSKAKELTLMMEKGALPIAVTEVVITGSEAEWKAKALELDKKVDAFFIVNHNTLKDAAGKAVDPMRVGSWFLNTIRKPSVAHERQFVTEGFLCAVDDSGFKQGFEAVRIADRILAKGEKPEAISVYAPSRGKFLVNRVRAEMLGLDAIAKGHELVEEYVEKSVALEKYPRAQ